jgi:hypothetical protein
MWFSKEKNEQIAKELEKASELAGGYLQEPNRATLS